MNIISKVTLKSLKQNKVRTLVTIVGIILSASMICAVTTFAETLRHSLIQSTIIMEGDYFSYSVDISAEKIDELKKDSRLEKISTAQEIGYAELGVENNVYGRYYYYIQGLNESYFENMPVHLLEGRLPQNSNEIIISSYVADEAAIMLNIGDTLTLDIGERMFNGSPVSKDAAYYEKESFVSNERREYKIVGIYAGVYYYNIVPSAYHAFTVQDSDADTFDIYCKTYKAKDIYDFVKDHNINADFAGTYLAYYGASNYDHFYSIFYGFIGIVIAIIMFGSVALIYNAFSISVSERTKQFGLLSSVGATKKQLRFSVLFEAFFVSIIGIPIGIIAGIGGIGITLWLLQQKISWVLNADELPLKISWFSVLSAVLIAAITVLISAWIPAKRATKCTAIEAIRLSKDIKTKDKPIKVSRLTKKLFGFEGTIAAKYFKRSRKKYRSTVISLFMSIVLFISASSFAYYLTASSGIQTDALYDIMVYANFDETVDLQELYNKTKKLETITYGEYTEIVNVELLTNKEMLADSFEKAFPSLFIDCAPASIIFMDEESFDKLLEKEKLDKSKFMNKDDPLGILLNYHKNFISDTQKYYIGKMFEDSVEQLTVFTVKEFEYRYTYTVFHEDGTKAIVVVDPLTGEEHEIDFDENTNKTTLNIGAHIANHTLATSEIGYYPCIIYPMSAKTSVFTDAQIGEAHIDKSMYFTTSDSRKTSENIYKVARSIDLSQNYFHIYDLATAVEEERNLIIVINVFAYGFIILISLIAIANVFNTISTNINLRRREFAMLKTVGMTEKGFNKMMNLECIMYGTRSLLFGLPVSFLMTYFIYKITISSIDMEFVIPWKSVVIAIFSVFSVVFATMMYAMRKIKKDNPIDALKNENL